MYAHTKKKNDYQSCHFLTKRCVSVHQVFWRSSRWTWELWPSGASAVTIIWPSARRESSTARWVYSRTALKKKKKKEINSIFCACDVNTPKQTCSESMWTAITFKRLLLGWFALQWNCTKWGFRFTRFTLPRQSDPRLIFLLYWAPLVHF